VSFEKFVDSPYSIKRPSPHLHKVPTRSNEVRQHTMNAKVYGKWRKVPAILNLKGLVVDLGVGLEVMAKIKVPLAQSV
jgi:hypothetical protein